MLDVTDLSVFKLCVRSKRSYVFCGCNLDHRTQRGVTSPMSELGHSIKQIQPVNAAVRTILSLPIVTNAITVKHYWWIAMSLREKLLLRPPHEIPRGEEYARILFRLVEKLDACPGGHHPEYVLYSRPRDYVACLNKLLVDMAEGFVLKRQTGVEDDVFIVRNKELHTDHLCSLASRLRGA